MYMDDQKCGVWGGQQGIKRDIVINVTGAKTADERGRAR